MSIPLILVTTIQICWTNPTQNVDGSPLEDLAKITLHAGAQSGQYTQQVDVLTDAPGDNICYLWQLDPGEWRVAATATDSEGEVSALSNEVAKTQEAEPGTPVVIKLPTQADAEQTPPLVAMVGETGKDTTVTIQTTEQYFMSHLIEWGGSQPTLRGGVDGTWSFPAPGDKVWTFKPPKAGLYYVRVSVCDSTYTSCGPWINSYDQGFVLYFKLQAPSEGGID
jgi:hypothetical protein